MLDETNSEAEAGVERADVEAVNAKANREVLYADRVKIHPKLVHGFWRNMKWVVMGVTLAVYYLTPWIRWDRGPHLPDQAVLIDFANRRFFFFFIEIWPQEFYFITGLLVLAALILFLMTALAGRVWCGYMCPQTVWTDLMIMIERLVEGDRARRIVLDKLPMSGAKLAKRVTKHALYLLVALLTGGAWVFYFGDAPTLLVDLFTGDAPIVAYTTIGILTATTYLLGGLAREQVCTYMCPWPRIQGAMIDDESLMVTYREYRGEPRGRYRKGESWEGRGDCIDCKQCVVVCPMGIDIRDGPQLECINCALCIDACNDVMGKIGRPGNLIAYDSFQGLENAAKGKTHRFRPIRPRTLIYAGLIAVVGLVMLTALMLRSELEVNVLRDRNPLFVRLADGGIRNGYTLRVLNKQHESIRVALSLDGLEGAELVLQGHEGATVDVPTDNLQSLRAFVSIPPETAQAAMAKGREALDFAIVAHDLGNDRSTYNRTTFRLPERR